MFTVRQPTIYIVVYLLLYCKLEFYFGKKANILVENLS